MSPRFGREIIVRLDRLLRMRYRPSEIATELACHVDTIYRSYIPAGCPHERDGAGHIWIVGTEFAKWARAESSQKHASLADGEAYCFRCRRPTKMTGPIAVRPTNHYLEIVTGRCSECGTEVNRARARCKAGPTVNEEDGQ